MKDYGNEEIGVFMRDDIKEYLEEFSANPRIVHRGASSISIAENRHDMMKMTLRNYAEYNEGLVQPVAYALLTTMDDGVVKIFRTHRVGGDDRLVGSYSIGLGGHLGIMEAILYGSYYGLIESPAIALQRELKEEVGLDISDSDCIKTFEGLIYYDETCVSSLHLGFVYHVSAPKDAVCVMERDKMSGEWVTVEQLMEDMKNMKLETWSEIVLEDFIKKQSMLNDKEGADD